MNRRTGQNGTVELRKGVWRGRYLVDIPGQAQRQKRSVWLGLQKEMTKSEARRKLKEIIHAGGLNSPTYVIPAAESLSEIVEQWEMTYLSKRKPSTQATMRYHLDKYLLPKWGATAVDHITGFTRLSRQKGASAPMGSAGMRAQGNGRKSSASTPPPSPQN